MCCCFGSSTGLGFVLFFERKREMMLDIEKPCCEELEGSTTAMMNGDGWLSFTQVLEGYMQLQIPVGKLLQVRGKMSKTIV
jgi:hypothetical protein